MFPKQYLKVSYSLRSIINFKFPINKVVKKPLICCCNHSNRYISSNKTLVKNTALSSELSKNKKNNKGSISSEDILEKFITGLSADIHQKNRVYKNDFVRVIEKIKEIKFSTKKQDLLLISCCAELLPDEAPASKMLLLEEVWDAIKSHAKFDVDYYNELLKVYIANKRRFVANSFISQMSPLKPNNLTFELMLKGIAEFGDINQVTEIITNMKSLGMPASEDTFNSLIKCYGKGGKLDGIQEVLTMMNSLKINHTVDTYTACACVYAWNKNNSLLLEELYKARRNGIQFGESHIMAIVKNAAFSNNYEPIPKILKHLPEEILKSPSISAYMQSVSTYLVFQNHPIVALEIYKCLPLPSFGPKDDKGLHGRSLVRDCVKASMPSSVIGLVTQELMASGRNPIALQNAAECALQQGKVALALDLFTRMKQLGMPLRPHYFWPILTHTSKTYGEKGIMNTLSTMVTMDVRPDYETILDYTLPYVSFTSPQNLMKKFLETDLTVSTVLTPMMETLLNTGQVRAASEICELFEGKVDVEHLLYPLLKGYLISNDMKSLIHILEDINVKALDKNKDWTGRFLCKVTRSKKSQHETNDLLNIVNAIKRTKLKVSTTASDFCLTNIPAGSKNYEVLREALIDITDERIVDEGVVHVPHMPHPKQMNETSLRSHLNELEAKGMNTRGVLRKLLQQYCRENNLQAAREIAVKCEKEGVFLSAGMKAAIFDLHVKLGELDMAELTLSDLNKTSPGFVLDEFKIIDFATLMVYRNKIEQAFNLIEEQSKKRRIVGGNSISMNCWRLLDAVAAQASAADAQRMFDILHTLNYCKPTNAMLGPLVRAHLKNENYQEAVNEFLRLSQKYKKTPLKHELLCKILRVLGEGKSEEAFLLNERVNGRYSKMVQSVLAACKQVHGSSDVQLTLIAALADVGYKKTLRKVLLDPQVKIHPEALLRYCERFADEKKLDALESIAECSRDLRHVNTEDVYSLMIDVYQRDDNWKDALSLWSRMQEAEIVPSQKFLRNICALCKANKKPVPPEISLLVNKQAKSASN